MKNNKLTALILMISTMFISSAILADGSECEKLNMNLDKNVDQFYTMDHLAEQHELESDSPFVQILDDINEIICLLDNERLSDELSCRTWNERILKNIHAGNDYAQIKKSLEMKQILSTLNWQK